MSGRWRRWIGLLGLVGGSVLAWVCVYGWVAAATQASVAVYPTSAARGNVFRFYATDLPANTTVQAQVQRPNNTASPMLTYTTDAQGRLAFPYLSQAGDPTGVYTGRVQVGADPPVTANFTVTAPTHPNLTVYPFSGSAVTTFSLIGAGYTPMQSLQLVLERADGISMTLASGANTAGGLESNLPAPGLPQGTHSVTVVVNDQPVASAQFRIGPLPPTCRDLLANPGFEDQPDFLGWDHLGDPFVSTQAAFSGQRVAVLGGYANAQDQVSQAVAIPASTEFAELSYWRARVPENSPGTDQMRITLTRPDGVILETLETIGANSVPNFWERLVTELPYSGQTIRLNYLATNDQGPTTSYGVDETALIACSERPQTEVGPRDPTLRPVALTTTVAPGGIVTVDVWVENMTNLFSADVTLTYNPAILRARSNQVRVGPFLYEGGAVVTRNQVNLTQGTAQLVLTRVAPMTAVSGSGVLFSLDFDALALGSTSISLSEALAAAPGGAAIHLERLAQAITIQPASASLVGQAQAGGRTNHSGLTISLSGPTAKSGVTNSSGDFKLTDLAPGSYTVQAKRQGWLCAERYVTLSVGQTLTLPTARLLAGDINGDDDINIFDLVRVAYAYDGPASADPISDLNGNGEIEIGDLVLVATNYGQDCPQPWSMPSRKRDPRLAFAPRLFFAPQPSLPDGSTPVEVWADGLANLYGFDLTLGVKAGQVLSGENTAFTLAPVLTESYVVQNTVHQDKARLAVTLLHPATPLTGKIHLATLRVKGDATALTAFRAAWIDAEGRALLTASTPPSNQSDTLTPMDKAGLKPRPLDPAPAWRRPVEARLGR